MLLAAIAPRPFFLVGGLNDEVSNNWGDEQSFHSANKVHKLLGEDAEATGKLGLLKVSGYHGANDWEQAMAWLDIQFDKSDKKWTNHWQFPWGWEKWKAAAGETVDLLKYPERQGTQLLEGVKTRPAGNRKLAGLRKKSNGCSATARRRQLQPFHLNVFHGRMFLPGSFAAARGRGRFPNSAGTPITTAAPPPTT